MFAESDYQRGASSFRRPVPPVLVDPQDEPTLHFRINPAWLPVLRGAVQQLCLPATWETHTDAERQLILGRAQELLTIFDDIGDAVGLTDVRQDVGTPCILEKTADGITWTPFANTALCAPLVRVRPKIVGGVTGQITQTSTDGGTTWQDVPGSFYDPKVDGIATPAWTTPPTGQDGKCLAAWNIGAALQEVIDTVNANYNGALSVLKGIEALSVPLAFFVPPEAIVSAAVAIGIAIGTGTQTEFNAALTADVMKIFRCAVYQHDTFDGTITPFQFSEIRADIMAATTGIAQRFITSWMDALGPVGMTNASGTAGITTADCSECTPVCETFYDFTTGLHGWTVDIGIPGNFSSGFAGAWEAGKGIEPTWHDYGSSQYSVLSAASPVFAPQHVTSVHGTVKDLIGNGTGDRFAFQQFFCWFKHADGSLTARSNTPESNASWWAGETATFNTNDALPSTDIVQVFIGGWLQNGNGAFYDRAWAITDITIHCA